MGAIPAYGLAEGVCGLNCCLIGLGILRTFNWTILL